MVDETKLITYRTILGRKSNNSVLLEKWNTFHDINKSHPFSDCQIKKKQKHNNEC